MKFSTDKNGKTWVYVKGCWVLENPNPKNLGFKPDVYLEGDPKIEAQTTTIVETTCKCGCGRTFHSTSKIYYSNSCQKRKYRKPKQNNHVNL